ncbi:hypothetical protein Tco_1043328 [Tanacetum coccineum]|uniref:Uncharacterized protein n=1 Tax=Tanacetum coccineum TaxID=301880 RepID=A0ABQ5GLP9_9ASTR
MAFSRLQELVVAENSNNLTDAMLVYIQRQINVDLQFAAGLSHLYEVLYSRVHEHRLLIAELNVFGGLLALQSAKFFKQLSKPKITMIQDNGYAFVEVQEDGTKPICIDCWFEAQPCHGMSFDTRPEPDREAIINVFEVTDDCMSPQRTDTSEDKTEPPATHGIRSPTSKSLTK